MSRIASSLAGAALGLFGLSAAALAAVPGTTLPEANLRAGPGRDYPLISLVPPGRPTEIFGCVGGYGWCDVAVDGMRGFISGRKLQVLYRDRRVDLSYYGPRLELPVIQFDIGAYWGRYYPGRPFYAERFRWEHGPDIGHGFPPPPHPEPEHGFNDYNHPAPPVHPQDDHGYGHSDGAPAPGPADHDRRPSPPPPESDHHTPAAPGPSHPAPNAPPPGAPHPAPPTDQTHPDHNHDHPPAPGQPPQ
jgi:uncharacterized protein YraI